MMFGYARAIYLSLSFVLNNKKQKIRPREISERKRDNE